MKPLLSQNLYLDMIKLGMPSLRLLLSGTCKFQLFAAEIQVKGGMKDKSKIIFLIS